MFIDNLKLLNYRNIEFIDISFKKGINIIHGKNGSGKTNILESINLLSYLKSFNSTKDKDIIRWGEKAFYCSCLYSGKKYEVGFGLKENVTDKKIKINGFEVKTLSEYYGKILSIVFSPYDLNIIEGYPEERRKFFDSIISKIDVNYLKKIIKYKRIIKLRSQVLKTGKDKKTKEKELSVWDDIFSELSISIYKERKKFISFFSEYFSEKYSYLSKNEKVNIEYSPDVEVFDENYFLNKLRQNRDKEILLSRNLIGPHRDNFNITFYEKKVFSYFASQGQKRTAAVSLRLAEKEIIEKEKNQKAIILVDDIFSEFDEKRKKNFINNICDENQVIFTFADNKNMEYFDKASVFEIEGGKVINEI